MKISDLVFTTPEKSKDPEPPREKSLPDGGLSFQTVAERFAQVCRRYPECMAVSDGSESLSFAQLDQRSLSIAAFLEKQGLKKEGTIGVMCGRSVGFVAAFMGIVRAGGVYVPIDPVLPVDRRQTILSDSKACFLITDKSHAGIARKLAYACPEIRVLLCLDTERFEDAVEPPGELMSVELWHHVSQSGPDCSWKSFFTGLPLPASVLDSLAQNLVIKTGSILGEGCRVLDIGSGAGRVARAVMEKCSEYTCVDISRLELDRVEEAARDFADLSVRVHQMQALDIHLLDLKNLELVIINSVIENFPGFHYLGKVLDHAVATLADNGCVFVGSIWDLEQKDTFLSDLEDHAQRSGDYSGMIRLTQGEELFVPKIFFEEWARACPWELELEFSAPLLDEPELTLYRYDLIIRKTGKKSVCPPPSRYFGSSNLPKAQDPEKACPDSGKNISPDSALYIIYTSGTTGKPKGVVIEQAGLVNLYEALEAQVYGSKKRLELALLASFSFDASMQQLAAALMGGHSLHIVPDRVKTDPRALYHYLEDHSIDICDGTPSLFSLLTDFCRDHEKICTVNTFILGGEPLKSDVLGQYFALDGHGSCRIINAYGPTECSVDATLFTFTKENHNAFGTPPIGYALPNTDITVRGKGKEILPPGMAGEIWISGSGLARGYFHAPELTMARFQILEGKRWYKTGDMGRYMQDGLLFFSRREDDQVKIGGFRVELGEVEAALNRCPLVERAVVRAGDFSGSGVNTLACYFIPRGKADIAAIRGFLGKILPRYAVPSHYIPMTTFPLNSRGKIDFYSLPSPLRASPSNDEEESRPFTPMEQQIAELWQSLLGRAIPSVQADFFAMGGHSILGVRLITLMEKKFNRRLTLIDLYRASTIKAQAKLLEQTAEKEDTGQSIIPFFTAGDSPAVFLFHPVGGHALRYQYLAEFLQKDFRVFGVQAPGVDRETPLLSGVKEMAECYLAKILARTPKVPLIFAGWSFGGLVAFEAACCLEKKENRTARVILLDTVADNRLSKKIVAQDESVTLERLFRQSLGITKEQLHRYKGRERLNFLINLGVDNGMLPTGFSQAQMRRLLQIYNGNALAAARYQPGISRGCGLLIRPSQAIESAMAIPDDPLQGWDGHFAQGLELAWIKGDHESMLTKQGSGQIYRQMKVYLDKNPL